MYEKLTKCPNFTRFLCEKSSKYPNFLWYLPEKLTKFSNFTILSENARIIHNFPKNIFPDFFFGGGACALLLPSSSSPTPMTVFILYLSKRAQKSQRTVYDSLHYRGVTRLSHNYLRHGWRSLLRLDVVVQQSRLAVAAMSPLWNSVFR